MRALVFVIVFLAAAAASLEVSAQEERRFIRRGNKAYDKQEYDKASENYMKAMDRDENSIDATSNIGSVLYKQESFDAAEQLFAKVAEIETDSLLKAQAYYDYGNTLFKQSRFEEALKAYKESLRLNHTDMNAKFNLVYTQMMLDKQKNDSGGESGNSGGNSGGGGSDGKDDSRKNDSGKGDNDSGKDNQDDKGDSDKDDKKNNDNNGGDKERNGGPGDSRGDDGNGSGRDAEGSGGMSRQEAERLLDMIQLEEDRTASDKADREKGRRAIGVRDIKNW